MNRIAFAMTLALASGSAFSAQPAASLASAKGSVMVNQGKQFVSAQSGQMLAIGDRVMVMEGGSASLRFADGCVQTLDSGSLAVVQSTCNVANVAQISPVNAQALGAEERDCDDDGIPDSKDGDIDGDDVLNADDKYEVCKAGAVATNNTGIWVVSGLAITTAAVLISDGDDETISP